MQNDQAIVSNPAVIPISVPTSLIDQESQDALSILAAQEKVKVNRVPGVKTVLVVLSSMGMVYDVEALRQKIRQTYSDATVYVLTTKGVPLGEKPPKHVDLLLDFTGPGERQSLFYAKKIRRMARVAVGRKAGLFRARIYDRVFDPSIYFAGRTHLGDILERERMIQRAVLEMAGVTLFRYGDATADVGKSIALKLPALNLL